MIYAPLVLFKMVIHTIAITMIIAIGIVSYIIGSPNIVQLRTLRKVIALTVWCGAIILLTLFWLNAIA